MSFYLIYIFIKWEFSEHIKLWTFATEKILIKACSLVFLGSENRMRKS